MMNRYSFDLIIKHSNETSLRVRKEFHKEVSNVKSILKVFDNLFHKKEQRQISLQRNIQLALISGFVNHIFSLFLLSERGLIFDAFNPSRSAIETTAFYWLVCIDPSAANLYQGERSLVPVKVREMLEYRGVSAKELKEIYSLGSVISHVGNYYNNLQIRLEGENTRKLLIAGRFSPEIQKHILDSILVMATMFVQHNTDFTVT
ncbi:MAG: hypothetical protein K2Q10_04220 [Rhodospirillales bacterium]|nr:hypothetical protein [Rhodospirillales bacterium]